MQYFFLIGRVLFGCFFLMNAHRHLMKGDAMVGYAKSKGIPSPKFAVLGSGVLLLIGGLSIITGFAPLIGIIALVLFLVPVTFAMHDYWNVTDPAMRMSNHINFYKNMALLGAVLMLLVIPAPWPLSF